jgi:hypothetical protein
MACVTRKVKSQRQLGQADDLSTCKVFEFELESVV